MVTATGIRIGTDAADGECQQGEETVVTASVPRPYSALLNIAAAVILPYPRFKALQYTFATFCPVRTEENNDKVIATNMADKIPLIIDLMIDKFRQPLDNLVPLFIAILVIKGLEVIQVTITDNKIVTLPQQVIQLFIDGHVARQHG